MTLNGVVVLIMRYFTEFMHDVVVRSSRPLSHILTSFLLNLTVKTALKSVDFRRSYRQNKLATFYGPHVCVCVCVCVFSHFTILQLRSVS